MTQAKDETNAPTSAKIAPIRANVQITEGKQAFLDYVAQCYDEFIEATKQTPYAILFAFASDKGTVVSRYMTTGEDAHAFDAMVIARAYFVLGVDMLEWEGEADEA